MRTVKKKKNVTYINKIKQLFYGTITYENI